MEKARKNSQLVRDLLAVTHSLVGSSQRLELDALRAFVDERGRLLRRLAAEGQLSAEDRETIRTIAELGNQAKPPIVAKRENLRREIVALRKSRRAGESLKPYRETRGQRLNIML